MSMGLEDERLGYNESLGSLGQRCGTWDFAAKILQRIIA